MRYTIKDLSEGKCVLQNSGTIFDLESVINLAFPEDRFDKEYWKYLFFGKSLNKKGSWDYANSLLYYDVPSQSAVDFLIEENKKTFTIKDFIEGKCAIKNDGTIEELRTVLSIAFPEDNLFTNGKNTFYFKMNDYYVWQSSNNTEIPYQSVKKFIDECSKLKKQVHLNKQIYTKEITIDKLINELSLKCDSLGMVCEIKITSKNKKN